MSRLSGKIALITGASTGIGFQTAKTFIEQGAKVIITGQNPERLAKAQAELGDQATAIVSDSASVTAATELAKSIGDKFNKIDIVFLNAGVAEFAPLGEVTEAEFDREYNINVKGPFFQLKALLPYLKTSEVTGHGASIIVNASTVAHGGMAFGSLYSSTKAAIFSLARNWAVEFAPSGIRVNTISPGPIETPIFGKMGLPPEQGQAMVESIKSSIPLRRFGAPVEIANAALFLASDEASFVTGAEILVDGGGHL